MTALSLEVVGADQTVPLVDGSRTRYVNLDYAASTPPLSKVWEAINAFLPYYSSVHRGAGFKSLVATELYESSREVVRQFFGATAEHTVLFTRNATDALNLLASALPEGTAVATFASEHHADLLPWQRPGIDLRILPIPENADAAVAGVRAEMADRPFQLLAVTGASNVTGELWPVKELATAMHEHGAAIAVDAAQLAPHAPIDMTASGIDYLAASGHKMYAPFGSGVLVGRDRWLASAPPFLRGGGAVRFVSIGEVVWADLPDREEAGSPNVVGAYAFAVALRELAAFGMDRVWDHDVALGEYARQRVAEIGGVTVYRLWAADAPRTGVVTFNVEGLHHSLVAAVLSAEHGIGVRHGCFCAHPLVAHLLHATESDVERTRSDILDRVPRTVPGAVRASLGVGSTTADVDRLAAALEALVKEGPMAEYAFDAATSEHVVAHDVRPRPDLGFPLVGATARSGESS